MPLYRSLREDAQTAYRPEHNLSILGRHMTHIPQIDPTTSASHVQHDLPHDLLHEQHVPYVPVQHDRLVQHDMPVQHDRPVQHDMSVQHDRPVPHEFSHLKSDTGAPFQKLSFGSNVTANVSKCAVTLAMILLGLIAILMLFIVALLTILLQKCAK